MTKSVIIAVNDPHILYLLQRYAEESGFQTISACQGKDLLALLPPNEQANPALIILDVESPGAADQKVWHRLRIEAATRNIPVVVYSCLDEPAAEWHEGGSALPPIAGCLPNSVMYDDFVTALKHAGVGLESAWPR